MIPSDRWNRMWELFHAASEEDPTTRAALFERHCADDPGLRAEVEQLLEVLPVAEHFLEPAPRPALTDVPALSGNRIGQFEVGEEIGRGGMGIVYAATQSSPRRAVALKVIRWELAEMGEARRRFRYEAEILGRLKHPGIAQIYDADTFDLGEGTQPYFAMELITGQPLTAHADAKELSTRARLELVARVCDAIHYAHTRGVVHGDLKPGNVLVDATGDDPHPKVLDFGVARLLNADLGASLTRTDLSAAGGTIDYMAPEHLAGGEIDVCSDVYSLGVVCYELLCGHRPYRIRNGSIVEAVRVVSTESPTRLSEYDKRLRGDIETITHKALAREPDRRYASAWEFADNIRRYLGCRPLTVRPESKLYTARKFVQRNPVGVAAVAVAALAITLGLIFSSWQAVRATRSEQRALKRYNDVRELARGVFGMHDQIANLPGSTPVRMELVRLGLLYLEELQTDATDDPILLTEIADGYEKLADVQGNGMFGPSLGDKTGARETYERCLAIRTALAARSEGDPAIRHALARTYLKRGMVASPTELDRGPIAHYKTALRMLDELATQSDAPAVQIDLVHAIICDGLDHMNQGDVDGGLARHRRALEIARELVARDSEDVDARRALVEAHFRIGTGDATPGWDIELAEALRHFDAALEHLTMLREVDPLNTALEERAAIVNARRAKALAELGRHADALESIERWVGVLERLHGDDPTNFRYYRGVGSAYWMAADVHGVIGSDQALPAKTRLTHLESARGWMERCYEHVVERKERGLLDHSERHYVEMTRQAIQRYEEQIAEHQPEAPASDDRERSERQPPR